MINLPKYFVADQKNPNTPIPPPTNSGPNNPMDVIPTAAQSKSPQSQPQPSQSQPAQSQSSAQPDGSIMYDPPYGDISQMPADGTTRPTTHRGQQTPPAYQKSPQQQQTITQTPTPDSAPPPPPTPLPIQQQTPQPAPEPQRPPPPQPAQPQPEQKPPEKPPASTFNYIKPKEKERKSKKKEDKKDKIDYKYSSDSRDRRAGDDARSGPGCCLNCLISTLLLILIPTIAFSLLALFYGMWLPPFKSSALPEDKYPDLYQTPEVRSVEIEGSTSDWTLVENQGISALFPFTDITDQYFSDSLDGQSFEFHDNSIVVFGTNSDAYNIEPILSSNGMLEQFFNSTVDDLSSCQEITECVNSLFLVVTKRFYLDIIHTDLSDTSEDPMIPYVYHLPDATVYQIGNAIEDSLSPKSVRLFIIPKGVDTNPVVYFIPGSQESLVENGYYYDISIFTKDISQEEIDLVVSTLSVN